MALQYDQNHPSQVETHSDSKHAGEEEDAAGHVLRPRAEANHQEFVNTLDAVFVVGADEGKGDYHTGDDGTNCQLPVKKGARLVSLGRCAQEGGGACFCGDDRGKHCPPRDGASSEGELLERGVSTTRPKSDPNDHTEVDQDNDCVDQKRGRNTRHSAESNGQIRGWEI